MSDRQDQRSGDQSLNVQAGGNVTIGLSYSETKDLAQVTAREEAREVLEQRMQELSDAIYARLQREKPGEAEKTVSSPDFQIALFDAQKGYAKTGNAVLRDMLLNLIVNRVGTEEQDLMHAVLGEAIVAAAKLIPAHFDPLTAAFIFRETTFRDPVSQDDLARQYRSALVPFLNGWPPSNATWEYLQYTGCGAIELGQIDTARLVRSSYPTLFPPPQDDTALNEFLKGIDPTMAALVDGWNDTQAKSFRLTVVGKAIAHANFERRTGDRPDLTIWVH